MDINGNTRLFPPDVIGKVKEAFGDNYSGCVLVRLMQLGCVTREMAGEMIRKKMANLPEGRRMIAESMADWCKYESGNTLH